MIAHDGYSFMFFLVVKHCTRHGFSFVQLVLHLKCKFTVYKKNIFDKSFNLKIVVVNDIILHIVSDAELYISILFNPKPECHSQSDIETESVTQENKQAAITLQTLGNNGCLFVFLKLFESTD